MTVICPSCDARFRDPPAEVTAAHPLQCSRCEHQWVREPKPAKSQAKGGFFITKPIAALSKAPPFALAAAVALTFMTGAVAARDSVMSAIPQTAGLFKAMGLGKGAPLEIANVTTTRTKQDGISKLIVRGEIANVADATVPVPPIVLTMRGKSEAPLYSWSITTETESLGAGEKSKFIAIASDYPSEATNLDVSFKREKATQ